jgi:hypothetical protein
MSRAYSINDLIERIRYQSDTQGLTVRHTAAEITVLINQAIQSHRERISFAGISHYLTNYATTVTAGATSPFKFKVLDLSSGPSPALVRAYSVDLTYNNDIETLDAVAFSERNDFSYQPSVPRAWAPMQTYKLAILPAPDATYSINVWYLPKQADLSAGETFDGVAGWEDEIVYEVCCRMINRDQFAQAFAMLSAERDRAISSIMLNARMPARSVIHRRRDTLGDRMARSPHRSPADQWWGRR